MEQIEIHEIKRLKKAVITYQNRVNIIFLHIFDKLRLGEQC